MFYRSGEFKLLEAGVKLTQMQQELHAHNIANLETPGYKAKSLAFRDVLREEANGEQSVAAIHAAVEENEGLALRPTATTSITRPKASRFIKPMCSNPCCSVR